MTKEKEMKKLALLLVLFLAVTVYGAEKLYPTMDALVDQHPQRDDTNYGGAGYITNAGPYLTFGYLYFDLSSYSSISSAVLWAWNGHRVGNIDYAVCRVDGPWAELSITWNNKPSATAYWRTLAYGAGWRSANLASAMNYMVHHPEEWYGMALTSSFNTASSAMVYHSRESSEPPYLLIEGVLVGIAPTSFGKVKALYQ